MAYTIDEVKKLFNDRAGTRGVSSNVSPDKFNRWLNSAELKFFNQRFDEYAKNQTISDSISKWFTDALYIVIPANGIFNFPDGFNLLHVDSMSGYLPNGTGIGALGNITPGSGYTNGTFLNQPLRGSTGTGATATIVVAGGAVTSVTLTNPGIGYVIEDNVVYAVLAGGSGFYLNILALIGTTPYPIERVEKNRIAIRLSSTFEPPTSEFQIYTQFANSFQFYPQNIQLANIVYLKQPVWSVWGYTLNGYIATLTGLVGGSAYTNGTYTNVPLTGGAGNGALATIVVSGGAVTSVTITNPGKIYLNGDVLSALAANIGGTGTGFHITVSSLVPGSIRPIYNPSTSIQPLWNDDDISTIVDLALSDAAVSSRDKELASFAENASKSQQ